MRQGTHLSIMEASDRGKAFCPAISANFEKLDTHNHDGVNSEKVASQSVVKTEVILAEADWVGEQRGFKQTVALPSGFLFDTTDLYFIVSTGARQGQRINPTIVKVNDTSFDVYVTGGNYDLKVIYS